MPDSAGQDSPLWRFLVPFNVGKSQFARSGLTSRVVSCRAVNFRDVNVAIVSIANTKQHKEVISEHV